MSAISLSIMPLKAASLPAVPGLSHSLDTPIEGVTVAWTVTPLQRPEHA